MFSAGKKTVMRPEQGLAVNIFLKQAFAHHQPQILARAPPRRICRFVDDMTQIIEASWARRLASFDPVFTAEAALPGFGCEPENLDFHAATFQRSRKNVSA